MINNTADIDVIFKTRDKRGDGYAFVFVDEEGKFDVSLLEDRIPTDIMDKKDGKEVLVKIFEEGKQTWSKENSLLEAVNSVFNFWCIPDGMRELYSVDVIDSHNIQLVLTEKSKK